MNPQQQLAFCKQCEKRTFDHQVGIVCSLTHEKPDFEEQCADFVIDPKETQKLMARTKEVQEEKSKTPIWTIVLVVLFVVRMLFRLMRD